MYSKTVWTDGENKYDLITQADEVLETDIKFVYKGTGGTPVSASVMNNIENGIDGIRRKIRMKGMI